MVKMRQQKQTRTVSCKDAQGIEVPVALCNETKPKTTQDCQPQTLNKFAIIVGVILLFLFCLFY